MIALARLCGIGVPDPEGGKGGPRASVETMQSQAEARARRMPHEALEAIAELIRQ